MSKIDDILSFLIAFLNGNDQSDTPQLRQALSAYTEACKTLNTQLAECRQLIACGLMDDARKKNLEYDPPLTVRAEKLFLEPHLMSHLQNLCKLYNYPAIPEADQNTLSVLAGENVNNQLSELVSRWRAAARKGSLQEKLKLLRSILKCAPEDSEIWLNNLRSVEQQLIMELLSEAERALSDGDGAGLTAVFMQLADPELKTKVPEDTLARFRPQVQEHQQNLLKEELAVLRGKIFNAYSSMNPVLAADLLREYDLLLTNPLYQFDPEAEAAIGEVRNYLHDIEDEQRRKNDFSSKKAELIAELDKHGDFVIIENLYAALKQLDLPLEKNLALRVENRRIEHEAECSRRHMRKCIYGVLSGVLLLALCAAAFSAVQNFRSYRYYRKSMNDLLSKGNFEGVIKLHGEVSNQSPILLKFGQLSAIKAEAEKLRTTQEERWQKISDLCTAAETVLRKDNTPENLDELKRIKQALNELEISDIKADLAERCRVFEFKFNEWNRQMQKKRDEEFSNKLSILSQKLDEALKSLQQIDCDLPSLRSDIAMLLNQADTFIQSSKDISKDLLNGEKKLLEQRRKNLTTLQKHAEERREIQNNLLHPANFQVYQATLQKLPSHAPDWAAGAWSTAVKNQPHFQMLAAAAALSPGYESRKQFDDAVSFIQKENNITLNQNALWRDVDKLTPIRFFADQIKQIHDELHNNLSMIYNSFEVSFQDADSTPWFFYSLESPILDRGQTSRIPKAIAMNVMINPSEEGVFLPFRVAKNPGDKLLFFPGKIAGVALPDTLTKLCNMSPSAPAVPRASHGVLLEDFLRNLKRLQTPSELENTVFQMLKKLKNADEMNIFARASLTRKVLDILPQISPFYTAMSSEAAVELDNAALHLYERWYIPTIHAEYPGQVKQLRSFFAKFRPEIMQIYVSHVRKLHSAALNRGLIPGGVIRKLPGKTPRIHWFAAADTKGEFWVYTPGTKPNSDGWTAYPAETVNKDLTLTADDRSWYNGMVVFFPADGRSTAELSKQYKKIFQQDGFDKIIWPSSWPLNRR